MTTRHSVYDLLLFVIVLTLGCQTLDPFLFTGDSLAAYELDAYTGETECGDALAFVSPIQSAEIRQVAITSGSDQIAGLLLGTKTAYDSTDTIVLYFHGRSLHLDYYWPRVRLLYSIGFPVLAIDYRGYGMSTGKPTEDGLHEDAFSSLRYIHDSLGNPRVILYAFSMGSLPGGEIAAKDTGGQIHRLVFEAPIGSFETMVKNATYLDLPGSFLTTYKGNNAERIGNVNVPFLWLHGNRDETLDYETNGLPIWNNYQGPAGYHVKLAAAGHKDIPRVMGYASYQNLLRGFIRGTIDSSLITIFKP